jgi:hypothetical protein
MSKMPKDYLPALVLLSVSVLLALALSLEWLYFQDAGQDLRQRLATPAQAKPPAPLESGGDFELPAVQQYGETVARPLFMENRRPSETGDEKTEEAGEEKTPLTLKLMGIALGPKEKFGLFLDAKGKYKSVAKNGKIDGWKLAEIEADKVIMEQGGERQPLPLLKPKPKPAAPPKPPGKAIVQKRGAQGGDEDAAEPDNADNDDSEQTDDNSDENADENDADEPISQE